MFVFTDQYSMSLYHGGILLLSIATALLVAVAVHPGASFGSALGVLPMRWLGERSYGIYLWHLPVIAFLPAEVLAEQPVAAGGPAAGPHRRDLGPQLVPGGGPDPPVRAGGCAAPPPRGRRRSPTGARC